MRFHLDENMPTAVAAGLVRRGFDVTTSIQAGLISASDDDQLAFAKNTGRVLITRDRDFLRLDASEVAHYGIVFWTPDRRTIGGLIRALDALAHDTVEESLAGRVVYL